ncbi:MAG: RNA polymerase sigma factor [Deltaproteobacteria bacterium]|nr:MAG: RNA polymerase sigma factor [Deltaproteobacteria bacterium]
MVSKAAEAFRPLIDRHCRTLYNFAFRMTLDAARAASAVEEVFLRAYVGRDDLPDEDRVEAWLLRIAGHVLEKRLPRSPEVTFDMLDETLRSEATRTDAVRSLSDPQRDFLLWELKQGCMTAVMNCLPPGERAAFALDAVLGVGAAEAAKILGVSSSAYKVRLSRARKKIADYLAPRCEHIDPLNPCRCPARVGIALHKGFIRTSGEVNLRAKPVPFGRYGAGPDREDAPLRDVQAVYRNLPPPEPPPDLCERMVAALESGAWDAIAAKKASR